MFYDDSSDSDEGCEFLNNVQQISPLPFNPIALKDIILAVSDHFDIRVVLSDGRARDALLITSGLTLAGTVLGKHFGGNIGAAVGGAVGGFCGLGVIAVSMRDIWDEMKEKLMELLDLAYDYIAGLGVQDYREAAQLLLSKTNLVSEEFATIIVGVASELLKKNVLSAITAQ